jgi:hypothetical protein
MAAGGAKRAGQKTPRIGTETTDVERNEAPMSVRVANCPNNENMFSRLSHILVE